MIISDHKVDLYINSDPTEKLPLIIVNTDSDDDLYKEITDITAKPFHLAQVHVNDWNGELSPWYGEAVFGKNDFKGKANLYLKQLEEEIIPEILTQIDNEVLYIAVAGYSLAGLFALYSVYKTDLFEKAISASGSLWYPDFLEYVTDHKMSDSIKQIYLSLGNKEKYTKNQLMSKVEDNTLFIYEHFRKETDVYFEFNEGNHFKDPDKRLAKAIAYILNS